MSLSDTARSILTEASQHPLGLAAPPTALPAAARQAVLRSLLRQGLVTESAEPLGDAGIGWRQPDGTLVVMQITDAGRQAIGAAEPGNAVDEAELGGLSQAGYDAKPDATQRSLDVSIDLSADNAYEQAVVAGISPAGACTKPHSEFPAAPVPGTAGSGGIASNAADSPATAPHEPAGRKHLRAAAHGLLAAWDAPGQPGLDAAIAALRGALPDRPVASSRITPRLPRPDTKQATVLAMLRRHEGASGPQLIEATGWAPHTIRGFLTGLGRKGITVTVLERVRQLGPNKAGAKGSYSIYRIAEAG